MVKIIDNCLYSDSALLVHHLLGYKIIKGFIRIPSNALSKVIEKLSSLHINYSIDGNVVSFADNSFYLYLSESIDKLSLYSLISNIWSKLDELDNDKLLFVLEKFYGVLYEG